MSLAAKAIGMSPITMQSLQGDANTAITAAGTAITTATDLTNTVNIITAGADATGVQLSTGIIGDSQIVYNATATSKKVYPSSATAAINQIAAGGAHVLAPYTACQYFVASATQHVGLLSA